MSVDEEATAMEGVSMLLDVSASPKINYGGVDMSTISFDSHVESFSCDLDKSSKS